VDAVLASFGFSPVRTGGAAPKGGVAVPLLDSATANISQLEDAVGSASRRKVALWPRRWPIMC
jgi:hypothetical protein